MGKDNNSSLCNPDFKGGEFEAFRAQSGFNSFHLTPRKWIESTGAIGRITGEVQRLLTVLVGEMKRADIQKALAQRHEDYFREAYLVPAQTAGLIEMTIPYKPTSSKQKYRLTQKVQDLIAELAKEVEN